MFTHTNRITTGRYRYADQCLLTIAACLYHPTGICNMVSEQYLLLWSLAFCKCHILEGDVAMMNSKVISAKQERDYSECCL